MSRYPFFYPVMLKIAENKFRKIVDYAPRDGRRRFLSSAIFEERNRRQVLQIARDNKCLHPEVHIIFSSTHIQNPQVFKYIK